MSGPIVMWAVKSADNNIIPKTVAPFEGVSWHTFLGKHSFNKPYMAAKKEWQIYLDAGYSVVPVFVIEKIVTGVYGTSPAMLGAQEQKQKNFERAADQAAREGLTDDDLDELEDL